MMKKVFFKKISTMALCNTYQTLEDGMGFRDILGVDIILNT